MDKPESEETIIGMRLYPTIWSVLSSAVNSVGGVFLFGLLASYGAPVTPFLVFLIALLACWNILLGWWWHYRLLGLDDEYLTITYVIGHEKSYRWSELVKPVIHHHRSWITPNYDLLEFTDPTGEDVYYYLSDLPKPERAMALGILRAKLSRLPEFY